MQPTPDPIQVDANDIIGRLASRIGDLERQAAVDAAVADARIQALESEKQLLLERLAQTGDETA